jgi:hypothetical protein
MKSDLQAKTVRLVTELWAATKSRFTAIQTSLESGAEAGFRWLRLRLSTLTRLSPQSVLLQLLALAATALMVVLAIGGLQTIAGGTRSTPSNQPAVADSKPKPAQVKTWGGLPTGPASPVPAIAPTAAPSPAAKPEAASSPVGSAAKPAPANGKSATPTKSAPAKPGPANPAAANPAPANPAPAGNRTASSPAPQPISPVPAAVLTQSSLSAIAPPQESAPADPTNYGDRYDRDIFGKPVSNQALIVLHETVGSADSAINTFRTAHTNESMQSSYHSIIRQNGTIVYVVPPEKRAFGAGNSVFKGPNGEETVKTHRQFPPSVNNFAYHVSLETPPDGANEAETHSGYTDAQYRSLAWLVAHSSVPDQRVTTHRDIDRSGSRIDPRSFDAQKFFTVLHSLPRPALAAQAG